MLPVSLLIALVIAFGVEVPATAVPPSDVGARLLETFGGITLVAALAFGLGSWVAARVSHLGYATSRIRRRYSLFVRLLSVLSLCVYAWIIHVVGWSKLVTTNWGLSGLFLVDDLLVFLPFAVIQLLVWWGLYFAERALHLPAGSQHTGGLVRHLGLRSRQAFGLILPVVLLYLVKHDMIARFWPALGDNPIFEPIEIIVLGGVILSASPFFVRLAWPTRPLPEGVLRSRLEQVARRAGFRFSDVLIWDTGHMMVNACVTGIWPGFRYVLLSDSLVETLDPSEAAAVFGHEVGHVAHRHLLYFAFFFIGSLGVLSLFGDVVSQAAPSIKAVARMTPWNADSAVDVVEAIVLLAGLGLYFWLVFGKLSRRFERQADVFGSKVVSCQNAECPPHVDADAPESAGSASAPAGVLCPVGIRVFTAALANVARFNGLDPTGRSWRHGSIASRIAFLEGLDHHPEREQRFQAGIRKLRMVLGVVLGLALVLSLLIQSSSLLK
jgi:STE24 endopeptidase